MPTKRKVVNGTLQEVPSLKAPEKPDANIFYFSTTWRERTEAYEKALQDYNNELTRCAATALPMSEDLKAQLQEGQEVVEGKEYKEQLQTLDEKLQVWRDVPADGKEAWNPQHYTTRTIAVPVPVPPGAQGSEIGIWLQSQIKYLSQAEGELVKVSDYAGGLSLKFANGNHYTLKITKQCQVTLD